MTDSVGQERQKKTVFNTGITQFRNGWVTFIFKVRQCFIKRLICYFAGSFVFAKRRLSICGVCLLEIYEYTQLEASASCTSLCIVICVPLALC